MGIRGESTLFLNEPPRTSYDLHFKVLDIPVRVHPLFWLFGVVLGAGGLGGGNAAALLAIWIGTLFLSILVHELGHAVVMRRYGESPRVVLYMMGGLAIADDGGLWAGQKSGGARTPREQIIISAAGPGAGFLLAIVTAVAAILLGATVAVAPSHLLIPLAYADFGDAPISYYVRVLVNDMLFVNVFWGLINLLPVYPLDGGQISRQLFISSDPWNGILKSLWLSVFVGGAVAVIGFAVAKQPFMGLLFGSLAVSSYLTIQQIQGGGGGFGGGYGGRGPW